MKKTLLALVLLAALPSAAEEITVDKVLAAQSFGVSAEAILAKVTDPGNTVPTLSQADLEKLRAAGVPEGVVTALQARAPKPAAPAAAVGTKPDNPRAEMLVKAVQAGTSEALIVDQITKSGVLARPTLNDLIYFKENKVPEGIIRALMEAPIVTEAAAGAKAVVPNEIEIEGLIRKTGLTSKNRPGKLTLRKEKIEWLDGLSQAANFEMFPAGLKAVETQCLAKAEGKFCHEVTFEMAKGSDFTFVDAKMDLGGNEAIRKLLEGVKTLYPKMPIVEKVK